MHKELCISMKGVFLKEEMQNENHIMQPRRAFLGLTCYCLYTQAFLLCFRWHAWLDVLDPVPSSEPRCLLIKQVVVTTFYLPSTSPDVMPSTSQAIHTHLKPQSS
jgi:hypothetical protein